MRLVTVIVGGALIVSASGLVGALAQGIDLGIDAPADVAADDRASDKRAGPPTPIARLNQHTEDDARAATATEAWLYGTLVPVIQQLAEGDDPIAVLAQAAEKEARRAGTLLPGLELPGWIGHFELEYRINAQSGGDSPKPEFSVLTVVPLYQSDDRTETYFTQLSVANGYQFGDNRWWGNLGVGYRHIFDDPGVLIGANLFYDNEFQETHQRVSAGFEARYSNLDLAINYYYPLSDRKSVAADTFEEALEGHDIELRSPLPYLPWARVGLKYFSWDTKSAATDLTGVTGTLEMDLHQNVQVELGVTDDNFNEELIFVKLRLVGTSTPRPVAASNQFIADAAFEARDLRDTTLAKVRRENKIILERTAPGIVIARGN